MIIIIVLEVEQATFTPLVFSTTGGMAVECKRCHSRLTELVATKKSPVMSRIDSNYKIYDFCDFSLVFKVIKQR